MDVVIPGPTRIFDVSRQWNVSCDREQLLETLRTATMRAAVLGRGVLASFTQPLEWCDAIRIFAGFKQLDLGDCFFWEHPAAQYALVGAGAAITIETPGISHSSTLSTTWEALLRDAVIKHASLDARDEAYGPYLFGGFAFDALSSRTNLWAGFPDGLLILPHILIRSDADRVTLTINKDMHAHDDIEDAAREIVLTVMRLRQAVERISSSAIQEAAKQSQVLSMQNIQSSSSWMKLVANTVKKIQRGTYEKVVLARGVMVTSPTSQADFDIPSILHRLRQSNLNAFTFALQRGKRYFVGATPERLARTHNALIETMALAGSAPRGVTDEQDLRFGTKLLQSLKNKQEHAIVVATICETLEKSCTEVWSADTPRLLKLKNVQHLETPIIGELIPGHTILDAISSLHPTPAVGGFPHEAAFQEIREHEQLDRGWYAGPVGWLDSHGNGEFAVALRSALIHGNEAALFAGCGIVAHSSPQSEYTETCLKFRAMLRGLGGEM